MKLEEAIETLHQKQLIYCREGDEGFRNALRLGIEALKRIQDGRGGYTKEIVSSLLGEIEEQNAK